MRVVVVDNWGKARVVASEKLWGRSRNAFGTWKQGETFVVLVERAGVIVAEVAGPPEQSLLMIWDNDLFEWRVPLGNVVVFEGAAGAHMNEQIRGVLRQHYPEGYGHVLLNQEKLVAGADRGIAEVLPNH